MPILDTQKVTDDLVAAGFPQPQARAVTTKLEEAVQAARGNLVTVQDLDQAESRLKSRIAESDAKIADRMRTHFIAMVATIAGIAGVTLAIARLLE